ncbi:MAG TPA: right-handed parallel beta-helix repeat-containing protein [Xanthomonadales bacterium]|nr:right-handed parallel beta-helix repeat-containing protein [Xanthomonadales bacterium]
MYSRIGSFLLVFQLACLWLLDDARATDGVLEINQACAIGPGCFNGDDPGLPVTITIPGSYRLTGNLGLNNVAGPPQVNLININNDDVSLDLNGFAIRCSNALTGNPCGGGNSVAIFVQGEQVRIFDGIIFGFPTAGISGINGENFHIENLIVSDIAGSGITVGIRSRIEDCTVNDTGGRGISAGFDSLIIKNTVRGAGDDGIWVGAYSLVRNNTSNGNTGNGFRVNGESIVASNIASNNQRGFSLASAQDGGGLARDNTANGNASFGMSMSSEWVFSGNVLQNNNSGNANPQTSGGIQGAGNICGTTPGCP